MNKGRGSSPVYRHGWPGFCKMDVFRWFWNVPWTSHFEDNWKELYEIESLDLGRCAASTSSTPFCPSMLAREIIHAQPVWASSMLILRLWATSVWGLDIAVYLFGTLSFGSQSISSYGLCLLLEMMNDNLPLFSTRKAGRRMVSYKTNWRGRFPKRTFAEDKQSGFLDFVQSPVFAYVNFSFSL